MKKNIAVILLTFIFFSGCGEKVIEDPCDTPSKSRHITPLFRIENPNMIDGKITLVHRRNLDFQPDLKIFKEHKLLESPFDSEFDQYTTSYRRMGLYTMYTYYMSEDCSGQIKGYQGLPPENGMDYPVLILQLELNDQKKNYLAVGGSKEDFEANVLSDENFQAILPENIEIMGYNMLYIPGTSLRKDLGLDTPTTLGKNVEYHKYGVYSDLELSMRTKEYHYAQLTLSLNGIAKDNLTWSVKVAPFPATNYTSIKTYEEILSELND